MPGAPRPVPPPRAGPETGLRRGRAARPGSPRTGERHPFLPIRSRARPPAHGHVRVCMEALECVERPPGASRAHSPRVRCRRPDLLFLPRSAGSHLAVNTGRRGARTTLPRSPAAPRARRFVPGAGPLFPPFKRLGALLVSSCPTGRKGGTKCLRQMRREVLTHGERLGYRSSSYRFPGRAGPPDQRLRGQAPEGHRPPPPAPVPPRR
jgi:hypothetical protein